jgi:hypothetical protein
MTLCVAGGSAVVAGFASGLGGASTALGAWSQALAADAPALITCDNFDGPDGDLAARAVTSTSRCGAFTWTVEQGVWSVVGGHLEVDGTADATATVPIAAIDATVVATVAGGGGVVLDHDGAATYLAAVLTPGAPGSVDLLLMAGGAPTTLASAAVASGPYASLSLTRDGSSVTVAVDGAVIVDHTLIPAEIAALGTGDRGGLYASNASSQFDNLRVTTPSPS